MITAKRALEETKEALEDQLTRAKNLVRKDLPTIEKDILKACSNGENKVYIYYTRKDCRKHKITYQGITTALRKILMCEFGYEIKYGQDIDNDLEVVISWRNADG